MKRSEIDTSIETAKQVFAAVGLSLPPFAFWSVAEWKKKGPETDEIRKAMLGWDVTDFGRDQFDQLGRTLFTLRNGYRQNNAYNKIYAEKFILDPPNQKPPLHFHRSKMEDIIVRAGGNLLIKLFEAGHDDQPSDKPFVVQVDGQTQEHSAGSILRLNPGQSICIRPRLIHQFWGEEGTGVKIDGIGYTVSGEVSSVCDDWNDNYFLEKVKRFPAIEEDEPQQHYLCHEYPAPAKE